MQAVSNTGRSGVLVLKVDEDDVNTVLMNTDIENDGSLKYAYDNFADAFSENILEYAFAYADIPRNQITKKQREAAQSLLKLHEIEKLRYYLEHDVPEEDWEPAFLRWYEKKGVLGEIVLHMFLKEFKNTIPLISKMYFKDSFSQEAKGFDAVHVSQDSLTLWLGETKFYKAWKTKGVVKGGIDELVEDLKKHITKDYLSEQYVIIKRGLETQLEHPQREEWIEKLSRPILLKDVFQYIRIPLLCIYEDDIALDYLKAIDDEKASQLKNSIAVSGDIVITHRGTLGQVALVPDKTKFDRYVISQSQFLLTCDQCALLPEYVLFYFHTDAGRRKLLANDNTTGVPSIAKPTSYIKALHIPIPPIELQQNWAVLVRATLAAVADNNLEMEKLTDFAQTLLSGLSL